MYPVKKIDKFDSICFSIIVFSILTMSWIIYNSDNSHKPENLIYKKDKRTGVCLIYVRGMLISFVPCEKVEGHLK